MTAAHSARLPECQERFDRGDEQHREVNKKLDAIDETVTSLKKGLLDGNGKKGFVYELDDRVQALEDFQAARAVQNDRSDQKKTRPQQKTLVAELKEIPVWAWAVIIASLGPEGWDAVKFIAGKLIGG